MYVCMYVIILCSYVFSLCLSSSFGWYKEPREHQCSIHLSFPMSEHKNNATTITVAMANYIFTDHDQVIFDKLLAIADNDMASFSLKDLLTSGC